MLSQKNRLILSKEFNKAHRLGQSFSSGNILLKVRKNGLENTKIGLSIGLRFSPKAVERNRVKRWLREIAKKQLSRVKGNFDIVVMLKKEANFPKYQELERDFQDALSKGSLIIK